MIIDKELPVEGEIYTVTDRDSFQMIGKVTKSFDIGNSDNGKFRGEALLITGHVINNKFKGSEFSIKGRPEPWLFYSKDGTRDFRKSTSSEKRLFEKSLRTGKVVEHIFYWRVQDFIKWKNNG